MDPYEDDANFDMEAAVALDEARSPAPRESMRDLIVQHSNPFFPENTQPQSQIQSDCPDLVALYEQLFGGKEIGTGSFGPEIDRLFFDVLGMDANHTPDPRIYEPRLIELKSRFLDITKAVNDHNLVEDRLIYTALHHVNQWLKLSAAYMQTLQERYSYVVPEFEERQYNRNHFWMEYPTVEKPSPIWRAKAWVVDGLFDRGFAIYRSDVVMRIFTSKNIATNAWEVYKSISDYIDALPMEIGNNTEMIYALQGKNLQANSDQLKKYLPKIREPKLRRITPERHTASADNGLWLCDQEKYIPYRAGSSTNAYPTAAKHFMGNFNPEYFSTPDPMDIPTPLYDSIPRYQGIENDELRFFHAFLGRLRYNVREYDNWQIMPLIRGLGSTGKTMITDIIRQTYNANDIGTISNGIEKQFGLSQIADKFIAIADDSTKDAQLDQQAFQQMVSAGSLSLGVKFKDALVVDPWKTPLIMTQNGDLHFHDNAGSIARRVVTFVFEKKIAKPDPDLFDKIRDTELLNIMVKQDRIYRSLARLYKGKSIWDVLPEKFKERRVELASAANVCAGFLHSSAVRFNESFYMPWSEFKKRANDFARETNMSVEQWTRAYYIDAFQQMNLTLNEAERSSMVYPRGTQHMMKGPFVHGVDLEINCVTHQELLPELIRNQADANAPIDPAPPAHKRARLAQ